MWWCPGMILWRAWFSDFDRSRVTGMLSCPSADCSRDGVQQSWKPSKPLIIQILLLLLLLLSSVVARGIGKYVSCRSFWPRDTVDNRLSYGQLNLPTSTMLVSHSGAVKCLYVFERGFFCLTTNRHIPSGIVAGVFCQRGFCPGVCALDLVPRQVSFANLCHERSSGFCSWSARSGCACEEQCVAVVQCVCVHAWTGVKSFDPSRHPGRHALHQRTRVWAASRRRVRLSTGLGRRLACHSCHGLLRAQRYVTLAIIVLYGTRRVSEQFYDGSPARVQWRRWNLV